ncbi:MAG TPA: hypothetical protein VGS22_10815 [Thermoanaerobaculia bacterium]|nr:hypothetical protein [Thermoanaerobaculia bacterium]
MNASPHRRTFAPLAGFLLILGLLALPAGASPRDWSFFSSPWSLLSALWENIGLEGDPNGRPSDIGLEMDPNGRTAPWMLSGNIGLEMDPSGRPAANPGSQNIGIEADPNG